MDDFLLSKKRVLEKLGLPDKSRKGSVDEAAWPMINTINSFDDFYTTSSCAGRINLFKEPFSGKKHEAEWLFVTHDPANPLDVKKVLSKPLPDEVVWFRLEPPIFHVACSSLESANRLLRICHANGWKRSGIISLGGNSRSRNRIMIEVLGNERIDVPVAVNNSLLVSLDFIDFLVGVANKRLLLVRDKLEHLRIEIESGLKD